MKKSSFIIYQINSSLKFITIILENVRANNKPNTTPIMFILFLFISSCIVLYYMLKFGIFKSFCPEYGR